MFSNIALLFKQYIIPVLLVVIALQTGALWVYTSKYDLVKTQLTECTTKRDELQGKIDTIDKTVADQAKAQKEANKKRQDIIKSLTNQVNTLQNQKPPQDCKAAIDWAIENKGDITW